MVLGLIFTQTLIRRAGVLVSHLDLQDFATGSDLEDLAPSPWGSVDLWAPNNDGPVPWLGDGPPASCKLLPPVGATRGIYRLWCPIPRRITRIFVYQNRRFDSSQPRLVIGIELHSKSDGRTSSLGFRTMNMEDVEIRDVDGEEIKGLAALKPPGQSSNKGIEHVQVRPCPIIPTYPDLK